MAFLYLIIALFTFLILTEIISVTVIIGDITLIRIDLTVLALELFLTDEGFTFAKKNKNIILRYPKLFFSYFSKILSQCEIRIYDLILYKAKKSPFSNAVFHGAYSSFLSAFIAFFEKSSRKFTFDNITVDYSENNKSKVFLKAKITISLYKLLFVSLPYVFLLIKESLIFRKGNKRYER